MSGPQAVSDLFGRPAPPLQRVGSVYEEWYHCTGTCSPGWHNLRLGCPKLTSTSYAHHVPWVQYSWAYFFVEFIIVLFKRRSNHPFVGILTFWKTTSKMEDNLKNGRRPQKWKTFLPPFFPSFHPSFHPSLHPSTLPFFLPPFYRSFLPSFPP